MVGLFSPNHVPLSAHVVTSISRNIMLSLPFDAATEIHRCSQRFKATSTEPEKRTSCIHERWSLSTFSKDTSRRCFDYSYRTDIGAVFRLARVGRRRWILSFSDRLYARWPGGVPLCVRVTTCAPASTGNHGLYSGLDLVFRFPLVLHFLRESIIVISLAFDQR
jgi:hypothetical protein